MRQIGKIKCLEVQPENENETNPDYLILFHGYGADAYDLQTLSEVIKPKSSTHWLFPQGVLEVPIGPGWTGRAWWNIDMAAIQQAAATGVERDMSQEFPKGLETVRPKIMEMIAGLKVPWNKIILGGFSQGAMLATDIFLRAPEAPKGLVILSGALICANDWKELAPKRSGSSFFMSHGTQDAVLSHKGAARLETLLTQSGLKGRLLSFNGGHEIPMQIIQKVNDYLSMTVNLPS